MWRAALKENGRAKLGNVLRRCELWQCCRRTVASCAYFHSDSGAHSNVPGDTAAAYAAEQTAAAATAGRDTLAKKVPLTLICQLGSGS